MNVLKVYPSNNAERLFRLVIEPIMRVVRLVTSKASCKCNRNHGSWVLYKQEHENENFRYYLKCLFCGYELAKKYWDVDYSNGHIDYLEGRSEDTPYPREGS